jgi:hypothetical protein
VLASSDQQTPPPAHPPTSRSAHTSRRPVHRTPTLGIHHAVTQASRDRDHQVDLARTDDRAGRQETRRETTSTRMRTDQRTAAIPDPYPPRHALWHWLRSVPTWYPRPPRPCTWGNVPTSGEGIRSSRRSVIESSRFVPDGAARNQAGLSDVRRFANPLRLVMTSPSAYSATERSAMRYGCGVSARTSRQPQHRSR